MYEVHELYMKVGLPYMMFVVAFARKELEPLSIVLQLTSFSVKLARGVRNTYFVLAGRR